MSTNPSHSISSQHPVFSVPSHCVFGSRAAFKVHEQGKPTWRDLSAALENGTHHFRDGMSAETAKHKTGDGKEEA